MTWRCFVRVPHPKQSVYFLLLNPITNINMLFCPLLPCHTCSQLSRIFLAHLLSVSDIISPGGIALFQIASQLQFCPYFLLFYVWRHFSIISVLSSVLRNPANCEHFILNEKNRKFLTVVFPRQNSTRKPTFPEMGWRPKAEHLRTEP